MKPIQFYLAGPMHGMSDAAILAWRNHARRELNGMGYGVTGPEYHGQEEDPEVYIARDMAQLAAADVVIAWLPNEAQARGTMMEICLALNARLPVLVFGELFSDWPAWIRHWAHGWFNTIHGVLECIANKEIIQAIINTADGTTRFELPGSMSAQGLNAYQRLATTTAIYPEMFMPHRDPGEIETTDASYTYPMLGLAGEVGEVAELLKKRIRDHGGTIDDETRGKAEKELGDVLWYVAALATELDLDLGTIALKNLTKLKRRAEQNTLQGSGSER